MSDKQLSREELVEWLGRCYSKPLAKYDEMGAQQAQKAYQQIKSLIEQKPVSGVFIEKWGDKFPRWAVSDECWIKKCITEMLTELGHEVEK